jgi:integrase
MRIKLTPAFCKKAKAQPGAERTIYWDMSLPGFGLQMTKAGHRSYVVQYRAAGRSRRMSIDGRLGLAAARERARKLFGEVAHDRDPLAEKRKAATREKNTFQAIAEEYFERKGKDLRSADHQRAVLERLVYKRLGKLPIDIIRRSDVVRLLDHIEKERGQRHGRPAKVMADRTLAIIRKIMNWHATRSDEFRSPIVRGLARSENGSRARILDDDELRAVWRAAEAHPGPFSSLVQFLLLTGARRSEASAMRWSEVSGSDWTLPAARNKTKVDLIRPLSPAALAVIEKLPRIGRGEWVFTNGVVTKDGQHPIGGFSHGKRILDKAAGVTGWTLHDLRRTARSLMSRAGVKEDAEHCLGHVIRGVAGVYDRHDYHTEKKLAYEALAALIERILNPQDNVRQLRAAK